MKSNRLFNIRYYLFVVYILTTISECNLYEKQERLLKTIPIGNESLINIYFIDMGATTEETIQVRIKYPSKDENVLTNFKRNYLDNARLINDSSLLITTKDTGSLIIDTTILSIFSKK
jgi:hypothetical protein